MRYRNPSRSSSSFAALSQNGALMKLRLTRKPRFSIEDIEREAAAEIEKRVSMGKPPPEEWGGQPEPTAGIRLPNRDRYEPAPPPADPAPVEEAEVAEVAEVGEVAEVERPVVKAAPPEAPAKPKPPAAKKGTKRPAARRTAR